MKKVFVFFAVAAMFVACNKPAQTETEATVDSVTTEVVETVDSTLNAVADSVVSAATDSLAAAVN